jgi:hypothetical protein
MPLHTFLAQTRTKPHSVGVSLSPSLRGDLPQRNPNRFTPLISSLQGGLTEAVFCISCSNRREIC